MTLKELKNNDVLKAHIQKADDVLKSMGYTEHSFQHVNIVSNNARKLLKEFGYSQREIELAGIAGYMHDIGNVVNRFEHALNGSILAYNFLIQNTDLLIEDVLDITTAIGHHDEGTAYPVNAITAALIIADKCDVRRNRVRNKMGNENIHYRVNFAVTDSELILNKDTRTIELKLSIDTSICSVMEYFEIFLERIKLCLESAKVLESTFILNINGQILT